MKSLLPLLFLAVVGGHVAAQEDSTCTYDRCALRLKQAAFSQRLVQGVDELHVATLSFFAPRIDLFAQRSDSAARLYASFRQKRNTSAWTILGGVAAVTAGLIIAQNNEPVGISLLVLGLGAGAYATIRGISAQNNLADAIWLYNRGLP